MEIRSLFDSATDFLLNYPDNYISEQDAIRPDLAGMQIYDVPLFAIGAANDPLFEQLKTPGVVGPEIMLPRDWVPDAKSVISFFLPFSETVRKSNRARTEIGSDEWFHGRVEGQMMMNRFGAYVCGQLESAGFAAAYPASDPRFHWVGRFSSNWSERHIAYVCGLGTFGLSKGLITKKGVAGRFGSVITNAELPVTEREYSNPFEYCTMCGKCQVNCPANAIDASKGVINGKDHPTCAAYVGARKTAPHKISQRVHFGCGKCQTAVPCESGLPKR